MPLTSPIVWKRVPKRRSISCWSRAVSLSAPGGGAMRCVESQHKSCMAVPHMQLAEFEALSSRLHSRKARFVCPAAAPLPTCHCALQRRQLALCALPEQRGHHLQIRGSSCISIVKHRAGWPTQLVWPSCKTLRQTLRASSSSGNGRSSSGSSRRAAAVSAESAAAAAAAAPHLEAVVSQLGQLLLYQPLVCLVQGVAKRPACHAHHAANLPLLPQTGHGKRSARPHRANCTAQFTGHLAHACPTAPKGRHPHAPDARHSSRAWARRSSAASPAASPAAPSPAC